MRTNGYLPLGSKGGQQRYGAFCGCRFPYLSCTNILNDYDGVRHDFTRKKGLVWQDVFLPEFAPPEWKDRGVLWNAVEENEKTKDSRLARELFLRCPSN